ncbi:hypothetical protein FOMA001_g18471 [Fusarium oxysporum f. sp. matthiolae]|nr:hypothetical protein FOMA001_g18471 [Fusarium oxysporum f. sp. matthiolae]
MRDVRPAKKQDIEMCLEMDLVSLGIRQRVIPPLVAVAGQGYFGFIMKRPGNGSKDTQTKPFGAFDETN